MLKDKAFVPKGKHLPILGNIPITLVGGDLGTGFAANLEDEGAKDRLTIDIMSRTGLLKQQVRAARYIGGLDDPKKYLAAKSEAINAIGAELTDVYVAEYNRQLRNGVSREKADKIELDVVANRKKHLMKLHEDEYPLELTQKVFGKIGWKKGEDIKEKGEVDS